MDYDYQRECSKCRKCVKFQNLPLRPFTLEYLALAAVLRKNISANDDVSEIHQNPQIFQNNKYRKKWKQWKYDIYENLFIQCALYIIYWLSKPLEDRDFHIATVKPFCRCLSMTCAEECHYFCYDKLRRKYSHNSRCKKTF